MQILPLGRNSERPSNLQVLRDILSAYYGDLALCEVGY